MGLTQNNDSFKTTKLEIMANTNDGILIVYYMMTEIFKCLKLVFQNKKYMLCCLMYYV